MARRRYQEGQLYEDKGRWIGRWREDIRLPDGTIKRKLRKVILAWTADYTKREAKRLLSDRLAAINSPNYKPMPVESFAKFAQKWIDTVLCQLKKSTQRSDRSRINAHLVKAFGDWHIRDITAEPLQEWVSGLTLSPKSIRNLVKTFKLMWVEAKAWGYTQEDPFASLKLPVVVKGSGTYFFTLEEMLAIVTAAQGWKKLFFGIMAETGIRPGEIAGLRRQDVQGRLLFVRQSVWQGEVQTPKTDSSVRRFAISMRCAELLEQHLKTVPKNSRDLVFPSKTGGPLSMDNFRSRTLGPILVKLGLRGTPAKTVSKAPSVRVVAVEGREYAWVERLECGHMRTSSSKWKLHDEYRLCRECPREVTIIPGTPGKLDSLGVRCGNYAFRHGNMTELQRAGVAIKTIQKRTGHAIGSLVTAEQYLHAVEEDDVAAAEYMSALVWPADGEALQ